MHRAGAIHLRVAAIISSHAFLADPASHGAYALSASIQWGGCTATEAFIREIVPSHRSSLNFVPRMTRLHTIIEDVIAL